MIPFVLAAACAPAPPVSSGTRPFEPFVGLEAAPDVASDRLCAEADDPDGAPDPIFIDCRLEGGRFAPANPEPVETLTLWTWNLERGVDLDAQIELVASGVLPAPDVLLIAEADRGCSRSGDRNVPWDFAEALGLDYVFAVEFLELPRSSGSGGTIVETCEHGNLIASRFPIGNVEATRHADNVSWYLPPDEQDVGEPRLGGRIALEADLQVGDQLVSVTVVHFESRLDAIDVQFAQAAETAGKALLDAGPVVVAGDTNAGGYLLDLLNGTTFDGTTQAFLSRGYSDAHASLPVDGRGTRSGLPIDLIFGARTTLHDPGICAEEVCGPLSDHQAAWARVALSIGGG